MSKRGGLGRGLAALIPTGPPPEAAPLQTAEETDRPASGEAVSAPAPSPVSLVPPPAARDADEPDEPRGHQRHRRRLRHRAHRKAVLARQTGARARSGDQCERVLDPQLVAAGREQHLGRSARTVAERTKPQQRIGCPPHRKRQRLPGHAATRPCPEGGDAPVHVERDRRVGGEEVPVIGTA